MQVSMCKHLQSIYNLCSLRSLESTVGYIYKNNAKDFRICVFLHLTNYQHYFTHLQSTGWDEVIGAVFISGRIFTLQIYTLMDRCLVPKCKNCPSKEVRNLQKAHSSLIIYGIFLSLSTYTYLVISCCLSSLYLQTSHQISIFQTLVSRMIQYFSP